MRVVAIAFVMVTTALGSGPWQPAALAGHAADTMGPSAPGSAPASEPPPQNYRWLIAAALLPQYLADGDGPAEISQPRDAGLFRKTSYLLVRFRLSAARARGMLLTFQDPPPHRYRCIEVEAERGFRSGYPTMSVKQPRIDPGERCAEGIAFEPFVELQRMAGKGEDCRQDSGKPCADGEVELTGEPANE